MEQVRYMISDAANIVAVESHVLRYWEDELELTVPRNELGHRYYTQENVDQFLRIKELKEEGYQLKAIKILLQQEKQDKLHSDLSAAVEHIARPLPIAKYAQPQPEPAVERQVPEKRQADIAAGPPQMTPQERMEQFQELMTQIVQNALKDNNKDLSKDIGTEVGDRVLKEMNYLMRVQDEQEEERFKKLDEAIRSYGRRRRKIGRRKKQEKPVVKTMPSLE